MARPQRHRAARRRTSRLRLHRVAIRSAWCGSNRRRSGAPPGRRRDWLPYPGRRAADGRSASTGRISAASPLDAALFRRRGPPRARPAVQPAAPLPHRARRFHRPAPPGASRARRLHLPHVALRLDPGRAHARRLARRPRGAGGGAARRDASHRRRARGWPEARRIAAPAGDGRRARPAAVGPLFRQAQRLARSGSAAVPRGLPRRALAVPLPRPGRGARLANGGARARADARVVPSQLYGIENGAGCPAEVYCAMVLARVGAAALAQAERAAASSSTIADLPGALRRRDPPPFRHRARRGRRAAAMAPVAARDAKHPARPFTARDGGDRPRRPRRRRRPSCRNLRPAEGRARPAKPAIGARSCAASPPSCSPFSRC